MVRKAREGLEKLGGEAFRPEIRETYSDRRGGKEVTVREKKGRVQGKGDSGRPHPSKELSHPMNYTEIGETQEIITGHLGPTTDVDGSKIILQKKWVGDRTIFRRQ